MRTRDLQAFCREVQAKLALLDWTVDIKFATPDSLNGNVGQCSWDRLNKTAQIEVLGYKHVKKLEERKDEPDRYIRKTVIHELGHILLEGHQTEPSHSPDLEIAIIRLENALIGLWET